MKTHRITTLVILAVLAVVPARAQLIINATATPVGGAFNYSYRVSNQTTTAVSVVTLAGFARTASAVQSLVAPSGYISFFDAPLGLLSFIEGSQVFAAGTVSSPFSFTSTFGPGAGSFEAVNINGDILLGTTIVASVPPVAGSAVPEPSTTAAIAGLFLLGLVMRRKILPSKKS